MSFWMDALGCEVKAVGDAGFRAISMDAVVNRMLVEFLREV